MLVLYFLSAIFYFIYALKPIRRLKFVGLFFYLCGLTANINVIITRWIAAKHIPLSNTYETIFFFVGFLAVAGLVIWKRDKTKLLSAAISLFIVMAIATASLIQNSPSPLIPALQSNWLGIHVSFMLLSYSAFTLAFLAAIFQRGELTYKSILFGFPLLTLGIFTGSVWANASWGTYWSWDPKETWALITWLVYAIYLHLRLVKGWKGKKLSFVAIFGFVVVLFTYFGVNYLLSGLHSYT